MTELSARKPQPLQPWEGGPDCPCGATPTQNHAPRCPNAPKRKKEGK